MGQYDAKFAEVYDLFMDSTDYDAWADYLISLMPTDSGRTARVFECGCGTGALTLRLTRAGYDVTGSDISTDMLEVAAEKARRSGQKIKFVRMDMRKIELHRPVDCIIAACDCVNYLTCREDVEKFLASAFNALKPGGLLLFDVSSRYKLQHILGQNGYCDSRADAAYFWQNCYDTESRLVEMQLEFFIKAAADAHGAPLYSRFSEKHIQRAHSERELLSWLKNAGFEDIRVYSAFTAAPPQENSERLQFAAKKPPLNK